MTTPVALPIAVPTDAVPAEAAPAAGKADGGGSARFDATLSTELCTLLGLVAPQGFVGTPATDAAPRKQPGEAPKASSAQLDATAAQLAAQLAAGTQPPQTAAASPGAAATAAVSAAAVSTAATGAQPIDGQPLRSGPVSPGLSAHGAAAQQNPVQAKGIQPTPTLPQSPPTAVAVVPAAGGTPTATPVATSQVRLTSPGGVQGQSLPAHRIAQPATPPGQTPVTTPGAPALPTEPATPAPPQQPPLTDQPLTNQPLTNQPLTNQPVATAPPTAPATTPATALVTAVGTAPTRPRTPGEPDTPQPDGPTAQTFALPTPATHLVAAPQDASPPAQLPSAPAAQVAQVVAPLREQPDGIHRLTVHLHPAELGPVSITAEVRAGQIHLHLAGATDAGREALRAALPDLHRELQQSGFSTSSLDVSHQPPPQQQHQQPAQYESQAGPGAREADQPATPRPAPPQRERPAAERTDNRLDLRV
jgi:flagellar hook-length control protein FliK